MVRTRSNIWMLVCFIYILYTMRTDLLNWCNLVSISKNVVFYAFLVVTKNLVNLRTFTKHIVKFTKYQLV